MTSEERDQVYVALAKRVLSEVAEWIVADGARADLVKLGECIGVHADDAAGELTEFSIQTWIDEGVTDRQELSIAYEFAAPSSESEEQPLRPRAISLSRKEAERLRMAIDDFLSLPNEPQPTMEPPPEQDS